MHDSGSQRGPSMAFRALDVARSGDRDTVLVGHRREPALLTAVHVTLEPPVDMKVTDPAGSARRVARRLRAGLQRLARPGPRVPQPRDGSAAERLGEFRALLAQGLVVLVEEDDSDSDAQRLSPAEAIDAGASLVVIRTAGGHLTVDFHLRRPIIRLPHPSTDTAWTVRVHRTPGRAKGCTLRIVPHDSASSETPLADRIEHAYTDALRRSASRQVFLERVSADLHGRRAGLTIEVDQNGRVALLRKKGVEVTSQWDTKNSARYAVDPARPTTTRTLAHEARVRGHEPTIVTPTQLITASPSGQVSVYDQSGTHFSPYSAVKAAGDKHIARHLFAGAGLSVARGAHFARQADLPAALETLEELRRVVVKPVDGAVGRGITVDVRTPDALRDAWAEAFATTQSGVLVEEMFTGTEVRFAVAGDASVAAALRVPPTIVGDGTSTVRELIIAKNEERRRNPHLVSRPIYLDRARLARLAEHGMTPLSVLPEGAEHIIDYRAGFSGGAESADVTDDVHPSYGEIAAAAVRAIPGMVVAGVDMLIADPAQPATADAYIIVEVNCQPGIGSHHFPVHGTPRNVAGAIIDAGLAEDRRPSTELDLDPASLHRPARRGTDAFALAQQFEERDFTVEWLAPGYFHARRDGITTNVWGACTSLTGHASVTAGETPSVVRALLEQEDLPVPAGLRQFRRDRPGTGYRHGKRAWEYARTLPSAALRHSALDPVVVDADDPAAFRRAWEDLCARGRGPLFVEEAVTGERVQVLVAYGEAVSLLRPEQPDDAASIHPSYADVAVRAVTAVPGLDIAEVVLALRDPETPAATAEHSVLVVRPRPRFAPYDAAVPDGRTAAMEIVDRHIHALTATYSRTS